MTEEHHQLIPQEDGPEIRRVWHNGEWWYVVVDFILTAFEDPCSFRHGDEKGVPFGA